MMFGEKDGVLCAPWSAPYMSLDIQPRSLGIETIVGDFAEQLFVFLQNKEFRFVSPPSIYGGTENLLFRHLRDMYCENTENLSYCLRLKEGNDLKRWSENARRNLRKSSGFGLELCRTENVSECYSLIERHHRELGYRMTMSLEQLEQTARILPVDFWMIRRGQINVAATYCYRTRPDVVQLINTGDTHEGRDMRASTFMLYSLTEYYRRVIVESEGLADAIFDYGPANDGNGNPSPGLVRFKTGHGFMPSAKTIILNYR